MSRVNKILLLVIAIVVLLLVYKKCSINSQSVSGISIIPEDIAFVATLDIPKFLKKSQIAEIEESDIVSTYLSDASSQNPVFIEMVKNPLNSGIDFRQNTFYALDYDENNKNEHFAGLILSLNDASKFENIVRTHYPKKIKSGKGFEFVQIDKVTIIGWNDQHVIFGSSDMFISLEEKMSQFFVTQPSNSIVNNKNFLEAINVGKDLSFWLSTTPFLNDKALLRSYGAANIPTDILKDNHITGYIDFGKGKMEGKVKFDFKPEMDEIFTNYFNDESQSDFSQYMPKNNCGFALTTSINIPGIYNYRLGDREIQNAVDKLLATKNLTTNQLFRTFGGDLFVSSYREKLTESASLLIGTRFQNRPFLNEILDIGVKAEYLIKESDDIYKWTSTSRDSSAFNITFDDGYPRLIIKDDVLFFISDVKHYFRINDGGYKSNEMMDRATVEAFRSNMMAGFFDMNVMTHSQYVKEDIFEKCKFSFDKEKLDFEINFKDKEVFALKTLINKSLK